MKAQVVHELGGIDTLRFEDIAEPQVREGQIRIGVSAAGVNFPDLLIIQGLYQFRPELPFVPGAEAAGVVLEVGAGVDSFAPGDRVAAFSTNGAMAEQFVVARDNAIGIGNLAFDVAATLPMAYGTSYHALVDRAKLQPGETLLVTGATGGVGSAAIQIGKALGARVIAALGSSEKEAIAAAMGADATINYGRESIKERVKDLTDGSGADVVYDPVGGNVFLETLRCVAWEGRVLVVGFASGTVPAAPMNLPLLKGSSIVGVFWGDFVRRFPQRNQENFDQLVEWVDSGAVVPHISMRLPLKSAAQALRAIADRSIAGKAILTVE